MQTTIQHQKSVRFGSGVMQVWSTSAGAWVNLGALKEAKLNTTKLVTELVADNARSEPNARISEAIMSCNLYEIRLDNMQLIDGMADYITVDGTPTAVTGESIGSAITAGSIYTLAKRNGDGTLVSSVTVKKNGTALVENTDYNVILDGGATRILALVSHTGTITADYTYTPIVSKTQVFKDVQKALALNKFQFVNTDADGKRFIVEMPRGYNTAGIEATFQPDTTTDDALSIPIQIKAYPVALTNEMFRVTDEQDVE
jgi:hypothetical protein